MSNTYNGISVLIPIPGFLNSGTIWGHIIFVVGSVWFIVECLATSLASTHQMLIVLSQGMTTEGSLQTFIHFPKGENNPCLETPVL